MAFNILPVIKFISQSKGIADTVNSLIKQYKDLKQGGFDDSEIKQALEVQAALNEQFEKQIKILETAVLNLERSLKLIRILVIVSLLAVILSVIISLTIA